jgi:outer membrane protein assembly factor BamB
MNRCVVIWTGGALPMMLWLLSSTASAVGLADSPWPDYGGGLRNTHREPVSGPAGPVHLIWTYDIPDVANGFSEAFRQPVLGADGTIYFGTYTNGTGQLTALHPNGSRKWVQQTNVLGFWQAVAANGQLYHESWLYSNGSGALFARSQSTGAVVWAQGLNFGAFESGPTIGNDGTVYTVIGGLTAVAANGTQQWQVAVTEDQYRNPAVASDGTVYVDGQFALGAVDSSGHLLWSTNAGARLGPVAIADDGNLFVGSANQSDSKFFSFAPNGVVRWQRNGIGGAASIGPDGTVYAGYQGDLHAIDPNTGLDRWTYPTGPIDEFGVEGVTLDADGNIYLGTERGVVMSLTSAGKLRWQIDLAPNESRNVFLSAPVIGTNGLIYVGGGTMDKFFAIGVPEPPSMILLGFGLFALVSSRFMSPQFGR